MIYCHGAKRLVQRAFPEAGIQALRLHHLFRLNEGDVIVTPRPWSPLLEAMCLFSRRRPKIVQIADGVIFPINTQKTKNQRYGGLQNHVFADCFIALQNQSDFVHLSQDTELISSIEQLEIAQVSFELSQEHAVLISGNDPFFDYDPQSVISAFSDVAHHLQHLGIKKILLSCPDKRLSTALTEQLDFVHPIGRLNEYAGDLTGALLVGSPSTVLLDHQKQGGASLLLSLYDDPVLRSYFSSQDVLPPSLTDAGMRIEAKAVVQVRCKDLGLGELVKTLSYRAPLELGKGAFVKAMSLRLILRDLHLLLGGRA